TARRRGSVPDRGAAWRLCAAARLDVRERLALKGFLRLGRHMARVDPTEARKRGGLAASRRVPARAPLAPAKQPFACSRRWWLSNARPQPSLDESLAVCILVFEASQDGLGQPLYVCR